MPEILEQFPDAHVSVAGNSITACGSLKEKLKISGYGKYLRDLIYKNGLEDKVTVLGSLSDVQMKEAYLRSHVFACPSALENSPNSLGEAMLLGLPCVASRTGGIPDMAEDGTSALFSKKVMSMGWPGVLSGFSGMRNWPGNCQRAQGTGRSGIMTEMRITGG